MLKMTKIELEYSSNIHMYLFVEKGMKGGISYIAKRFSKPNNKYMQFFDDKNPSKYITYLIIHTISKYIQIIYMVREWVNIYLIVDLNG